MQFVQVCINSKIKSLDKIFTYKLPAAMDFVTVGYRVVVPFGKRTCEGFILSKTDTLPAELVADDVEIKEVIEALDSEAWFTEEMLQTARELAEYYLCSLSDSLQLFVVGGSGIKFDFVYHAAELQSELTADEQRIVEVLDEKNGATLPQLKTQLVHIENLDKLINNLLKRKLIVRENAYQRKFKEKTQEYLKLKCSLAYINISKRAKAQLKLCELLLERKCSVELGELYKEGFSRAVINALLKAGYAEIERKRIYRNSYDALTVAGKLNKLNQAQTAATNMIDAEFNKYQRVLLHGITGSGKTEIYLTLTQKALARGKQVLILIPEIALTGQIVHRFQALFDQEVVVSHSKLSQNERMDVYFRLRSNQASILIGARSAIFAPFCDLGLIIIDEEHDFAYRQERYPAYSAVKVADMRAKSLGIPLLLGSATPSLESFTRAQNSGEYYYMGERANVNASLPQVQLVDMKAELQAKNYSVLSRILKEQLRATVDSGQQAIILLNRRGFSTFIMCRDCGYVVKCKSCDVSLVYHKQGNNNLRCHYCGYTQAAPDICPECQSHKIKFFGSGIQKLEEELQKEFNDVKILRLDQDTAQGKFAHQEILGEFASGEAQILIGTQMVAKGHDFPNVTLVGILAADSILNLPDFRAGEQAFALFTQMAGRAGRADMPGLVLLQTYNPENEIIKLAQKQNYHAFAAHELIERNAYKYPPTHNMIKIKISDKNKVKLEQQAKELFTELNALNIEKNIEILGPFYGIVSKVKDIYSMYLLIKGTDVQFIKDYLYNEKVYIRENLLIEVDPSSVI